MKKEIKLDIPKDAAFIIEQLEQNGYEAYVVGGCTRDAILGRQPKDWDITTSAKPQEVKRIFKRTVDTGIEHGTVTVLFGKTGYEVTTYRIDGIYEDSRHPKEVSFTGNLREDLLRRDFTINAMAYNPASGLVDEFGGLSDLENGCIRAVGNPSERFSEDALRILRAVRFAAQLSFSIEDKTKEAMKDQVDNLANISAERIREEIDKLLLSGHARELLEAEETGIISIVLPELSKMLLTGQENPHHCYNVGMHSIVAVEKMFELFCQMEKDGIAFKEVTLGGNKKILSILLWTMLLHDVAKPEVKKFDKNGTAHFYGHPELSANIAKKILQRLKFDNKTIDMVYRLIYFHDRRMVPEEVSLRKNANKIGSDSIELLFFVQRADILAQSGYQREEKLFRLSAVEELYSEIRRKGECISLKELSVSGKDLIAAGIPAGKEMGKFLNLLLLFVLEESGYNDKELLVWMAKEIKTSFLENKV